MRPKLLLLTSLRVGERYRRGRREGLIDLFFSVTFSANAKIVDHDRFLKGLTKVHLISGFAVIISFLVPIVDVTLGMDCIFLKFLPSIPNQETFSRT